jgi:hypothetical protein
MWELRKISTYETINKQGPTPDDYTIHIKKSTMLLQKVKEAKFKGKRRKERKKFCENDWDSMPEFAEGPAVVGGGHGIVHHREPVVGRRLKMYCSS